ncbi:MAG: TfoX/Sxy family protein [Chthoniobacterales bacterium]
MAANEELAERVRRALARRQKVEEKRMFGGIAFMANGKMCVTVGSKGLMCRIDPAWHKDALRKDGCSTVVMRGRDCIGWMRIEPEALREARVLREWLKIALAYNKAASVRGTGS